MNMSPEEGRLVVGLARSTLNTFVNGKKPSLKSWTEGLLSELRGVFVTINKVDPTAERLRGCIGFPYPLKKLGEAIQEATMAAASEDPRFPPVEPDELASVVVEVSVLTEPREIESIPRKDVVKLIRIGKDGLIISRSYASGLLLPQVATEYKLDQEDFLSQTCMKAGLPPDAWLDRETKIQVFQAEIFAEKSPGGEVERVDI